MNRYTKTLLVILASVGIGACAGKSNIITVPAVVSAVPVLEEPEAPFIPEEEIALLPIRTLELDLSGAQPRILDPEPEPTCDIIAKIRETATDPALVNYPSNAGQRLYGYNEVRFDYLSKREDYELNIGVRVLHLETCTTEVIGIRKFYENGIVRAPYHQRDGSIIWKEERMPVAVLIPPSGWNIEVIRRVQGVEWNSWGTELRITEPSDRIVIGVKWPSVTGRGKNRVTPVVYVPYSRQLHLAALIDEGRTYLDDLVRTAFEELRRLGVPSRAYPGTLAADVSAIEPDLIASLAVIEHMDPGEFALDPDWTTDRIHVVLGANRERTAAYTCSGADACGLMQFIVPTYQDMRRLYPTAKLIADVNEGRRNHLNAVKAAILLADSNFASFHGRLGDAKFTALMADRTMRRDLIRSAYNTGAGRTGTVYLLALAQKATEWTEAKGKRCSRATKWAECMLLETKGYLAKGRYYDDPWLPAQLGVQP